MVWRVKLQITQGLAFASYCKKYTINSIDNTSYRELHYSRWLNAPGWYRAINTGSRLVCKCRIFLLYCIDLIHRTILSAESGHRAIVQCYQSKPVTQAPKWHYKSPAFNEIKVTRVLLTCSIMLTVVDPRCRIF